MMRIAVIPNNSKDFGLINTRRLVEFLSDKADIYMDEAYSVLGMNIKYIPASEIYENAEYLVVLGGDGTILQRAAECARRKIPILGINLGKIGFMTEIEIDDMEEALTKFLNGDFKIENRMMIKAEVRKANKVQFSFHALNDVVVSKSLGEKLIRIELSTNGEEVNRYTADGLIIATPTGSTGYSISAGGPVADPCMRLYIATPICAHMLSVRSAVLSSDKVIKIRLDSEYGGEAVVTADGDMQGYIKGSDEVIITESEYDFELVRIGEQSFYDTLLKKLS
ncbi:MAG: NAD(+)/NADH kinase [Firmicutes bacterium]|nr:NAD(+)/NADH kinase [Bacillota bacterium]